MSADTYTALETAIRQHITDEADGRILTDWYLITASVGAAVSETFYEHDTSDSSTHVLMGLVRIAGRRLDRYNDTGDDEDGE